MSVETTLDAEFFIGNRARLTELFTGTAPIVITANGLMQQSADQAYPFTQDSNFWYLTGIDEPGYVLVIDGDKEYLIAPEANKSRDIFDGGIDEQHLKIISGIDLILDYQEGWKLLGKKLAKVKHIATVSPNKDYIPQILMYTSPAKAKIIEEVKKHNPELEFLDLRKYFMALRSKKTTREIVNIRAAIAKTAKLYKVINRSYKTAKNESEIMAEASKYAINSQSEFAYPPIIAGGINAVTLHYGQNNSDLADGEFLLVDIGLSSNKYCADITRTVVTNPTKRQQTVYDTVLDVQKYAISLLKPGVVLKDYEDKVHQFIGEKLRELGLIKTIDEDSVAEFYPHRTSHFLGIDTHDLGDYDAPLEPGMVLTVEPGIYIADEKTGIRIEDNILITNNGNEVLSKQIKKSIDRFA